MFFTLFDVRKLDGAAGRPWAFGHWIVKLACGDINAIRFS
jgi:hypothetical protein